MDLVSAELPCKTLVVAIDSGKVFNRVLLANCERGLIGGPLSIPDQRQGIEQLCRLIESSGADENHRARGDGLAAPGLGDRALAPLSRLAAARALRDPGRPHPARFPALQGR